jgi:CTP synthase
MQLATIEFARNVCGLKDATSAEFDPKAKNLVIEFMKEQVELMKHKNYGATMRLGAWKCEVKSGHKQLSSIQTKNNF